MKKKFWMLVMCSAIVLTLLPVNANAAVKLSAKSITVQVGKSKTIKVTGTSKKVKWSVKNKKIAALKKYKSSVKVTGKEAGSTVVTGKVGTKVLKCKVSVQKNVTSSLKNNKGIRSLADQISKYVLFQYGTADLITHEKYSIKLTDNEKCQIACRVRYMECGEFFDSNDISDQYARIKDMKGVRNTYRNMFGSSFNKSTLNDIRDMVVMRNGKVYMILGDVGDIWENHSIKKIIQKGSNTYQLVGEEYLCDEHPVTIWLNIKKSGKSSYGYKITKIAYRFS